MTLSTRRVVPQAVPLTAVLLAPLALLAPQAAATAEASGRDAVTVAVRVYEQGTKTPELTAALEGSVTRLLDTVGARVDVLFVDCARQDACAQVASTDTLVLRLAPGHHPTEARQCGSASMGEGGRRGVLMTIFRGCIRETRRELRDGAVAQQGVAFGLLSLTEADVLAVVVVHELIHLVLPGEGHGTGLFKATLDARDWLDVVGGWPQLDTALVSRLRQALLVEPVTQGVVADGRSGATPPASSGEPSRRTYASASAGH